MFQQPEAASQAATTPGTEFGAGAWWDQVGAVTLALVPLHQALVEVIYKTLYGAKQRRYYEALAYVIGGKDPVIMTDEVKSIAADQKVSKTESGKGLAHTASAAWELYDKTKDQEIGISRGVATGARFVPAKLSNSVRLAWATGPERRLIESLMLRGVGDSATPELGETDLNNIAVIARQKAGRGIEDTLTALDLLVRNGVSDPGVALASLEGLALSEEAAKDVTKWKTRLEQAKQTPDKEPLGILFNLWRQQFVAKYVPAEHRARAELANAIKSAEYRYHRGLLYFSTALALVESAVVNLALADYASFGAAVASFAVSFSALVLAPQGTKSLLDAIVGLGARLKV